MESLHSADDEPSCMAAAPFSFDFEREPLDRRRLQVGGCDCDDDDDDDIYVCDAVGRKQETEDDR